MDLAKFLSLISSRTLHFSRADTLGDPFEGSLTKQTLQNLSDFDREIEQNEDFKGWPNGTASEQYRAGIKNFRKSIYVNCWHMNSFESAAMWSLYGLANQGIAICSRYDTLARVLPEGFFLGAVQYADYSNHSFPLDNLLNFFMTKQVSYAHEIECRAVFPYLNTEEPLPDGVHQSSPLGIQLDIDLNEIIEAIFLHPQCPDWQETAIADMVSRFGLTAKVRRSQLGSTPIF